MRKNWLLGLAAAFAILAGCSPAQTQGIVSLCYFVGGTVCQRVDLSTPLPVVGSISLSGFPTTQTTGTPISVTTGGVSGTLPSGAVVVATNVGTTNAAYCKLGASATTSDQYIAPSGGWFAFTVGAATQLTCITSTSTTTVNMVGGSGLPTGTGGGSGGGGGAITIASGAVASGAYSSGSVASGAFASGSMAAGSQVDLLTMRGTKAPGTAAANSALTGCVYTAAGVTLTDGQQAACQLTATGGQLVSVANANANGQATMANSSPVVIASNQSNLSTTPYPLGATPYTATATGTTGATTATLAGASSVTTYLCGFSIRANATAAATGNATVTGVITATMNFTQWTAPNASGLGITEMIFAPCIPASGTNQSVAVVSAAPGTGGVVSVTAWGYKL